MAVHDEPDTIDQPNSTPVEFNEQTVYGTRWCNSCREEFQWDHFNQMHNPEQLCWNCLSVSNRNCSRCSLPFLVSQLNQYHQEDICDTCFLNAGLNWREAVGLTVSMIRRQTSRTCSRCTLPFLASELNQYNQEEICDACFLDASLIDQPVD